jgi:hypothetical protein
MIAMVQRKASACYGSLTPEEVKDIKETMQVWEAREKDAAKSLCWKYWTSELFMGAASCNEEMKKFLKIDAELYDILWDEKDL